MNCIYAINGPVVKVRDTKSFSMREMVMVGKSKLIMTITPINEPAFISIAFLVFKGLPSFLLLSITKNGSIISASANKGSKNSNIFQFLPKLIQISLKRLKALSVAYIETTEYLIKFKS
jgi:V/A-type H+/Na+-transporting ATPase subunit A